MKAIFVRLFVLLSLFYLPIPVNGLLPTTWSADSLPSQSERFKGMGSTFKEQKHKSSATKDGGSVEDDTSEQEEAISPEADISYFKLHTFVVNIQDKRHENKLTTLTFEVFCEINNPDDKWLIDTHIAPIKDSIITHVSGIERQQIQTQRQKKELQQVLSNKVAALLKKLTGQKVINDLYITRFIIQ